MQNLEGYRRDELELREKSREKKERRRRTPELQRPHSVMFKMTKQSKKNVCQSLSLMWF